MLPYRKQVACVNYSNRDTWTCLGPDGFARFGGQDKSFPFCTFHHLGGTYCRPLNSGGSWTLVEVSNAHIDYYVYYQVRDASGEHRSQAWNAWSHGDVDAFPGRRNVSSFHTQNTTTIPWSWNLGQSLLGNFVSHGIFDRHRFSPGLMVNHLNKAIHIFCPFAV